MTALFGDSRDGFRSASTLLVFDTPFGPPAERACPDLCQSADRGQRGVLAVLVTERPSEYLRAWHRSQGEIPDRLRIVSVDPGAPPGSTADAPHVVERLTAPADLTALGVAITEALSAFDEATPAVCVDSLTPLLQYVDEDRAVRFLHELAAHFDAVDARAHVHVDPSAHEKQTVAAIASVFDDVVDGTDPDARRPAD